MRIRLLTLTLLCSLTALAQQAPVAAGMFPADASGWRLVQPPRPFVGDELFKMINGGAALYLEYGFDRAVSAKYVNNEGKTIDYALKYVGEDRLFFGTDSSYYQGVGTILASKLNDAQKKKIFFENYNNILRKIGRNVS